VDDDPKIRELVSDLLEMEGYDVYTATNGAEALEFLERTTPRLVVLDIRMPVLDGWGFARAVKEQCSALPMLVMSGAEDAGRCATEIGAAGFVSKPFDLDDLLSAIERFSLPGGRRPTPTGLSPLSEKPIHPTSAARCSDLAARRRH
jgi:CheY-like chemotaxis protein